MALTSGGLMAPRSAALLCAARAVATLICPCRKPPRSWRSLSRTAAPVSRAVISSWLHVRVSTRGRHEQRKATRTFEQNNSGASRSLSFSLLVSPVDTTGSSSFLSRWEHVGKANVTTMHVVISLPSSCWHNQRSIKKKNISVGKQSAAPPLLYSQRSASHLRHHLISLIVDIFDTAVQIPRPRAQHDAVTWRHAIGVLADLVLLPHHYAFEAIGGCARQKGTCIFCSTPRQCHCWNLRPTARGTRRSLLLLRGTRELMYDIEDHNTNVFSKTPPHHTRRRDLHAVGAHVRVCQEKRRALECVLETHSGSWETWKNVRAAALTLTILARNPSSPLKWTTPRVARR